MKEIISESEKIVVLTGAGVSTESGIPDFQQRDENWKHDVDREIATSIWYFKDEPQKFWNIYKEIFASKIDFKPNSFHYFLADLQKNHEITIVTQNVDGLHTKAGSKNVIESHGNLNYVICLNRNCRRKFPYKMFENEKLPTCPSSGDVLKPNVSLFGEGINGFSEARDIACDSDLLIVAGTSLQVGPFNELPLMVQYYAPRTKRTWINKDNPPSSEDTGLTFHRSFKGTFSEFLKNYDK